MNSPVILQIERHFWEPTIFFHSIGCCVACNLQVESLRSLFLRLLLPNEPKNYKSATQQTDAMKTNA